MGYRTAKIAVIIRSEILRVVVYKKFRSVSTCCGYQLNAISITYFYWSLTLSRALIGWSVFCLPCVEESCRSLEARGSFEPCGRPPGKTCIFHLKPRLVGGHSFVDFSVLGWNTIKNLLRRIHSNSSGFPWTHMYFVKLKIATSPKSISMSASKNNTLRGLKSALLTFRSSCFGQNYMSFSRDVW